MDGFILRYWLIHLWRPAHPKSYKAAGWNLPATEKSGMSWYNRLAAEFLLWEIISGFAPKTFSWLDDITLSRVTCFTWKATNSAAAAAKSLQSCPTLCDPTDGSPPGSPVPETLQARTLEWIAISFSNAWKWKVKVKLLSRARLLVTLWTAAYQAPPSMGFSRQEYWSGLPLPSLSHI